MTAVRARAETVDTGYGQDVFWKDDQGIVHLVDHMGDRYRVNCARWMIDHAALRHLRRRRQWYEWDRFLSGYFYGAPDDVVDDALDQTDDPRWVSGQVRREQDRGEHLDWMRSTPLFRRMVRGVEHLVGSGVLG